MTQFMLCVPEPTALLSQLELRPLNHDDRWLREVARSLLPGESDVRVPHLKNGRSISEVFTEAHNALYNGRDFRTTQLQSILPEVFSGCHSIALWWGNEWSDLPLADTEAALVSEILKQLREPVGEVYARWNRGR